MFEYNTFYDYPTQVIYTFIGERDEHKAIAYGEVVIDLATGEVYCIDSDEIDIVYVSDSWAPYFLD